MKYNVLGTVAAVCMAGIIGATQGAYGGMFFAACTNVTFKDGVTTGAKWTALAWAGAATIISGIIIFDKSNDRAR